MATANPIQQALGQGQQVLPPAKGGAETALLDALINRGLGEQGAQQQLQSATPLEGFPTLPNPDPNSAPPLYGEPPGEGYLYARDPMFRQAGLVHTDPETVRLMLLRAIEVQATNLLLPFSEEKANGAADAILKMAQSYLLLDPSVDNEGIPVAHQAALDAVGNAAGAAAQTPQGQPQPASDGKAHGTVKRPPAVRGYQPPPRVLPGRAAEAVGQLHETAQELLQDARASRPRPRPRPSA